MPVVGLAIATVGLPTSYGDDPVPASPNETRSAEMSHFAPGHGAETVKHILEKIEREYLDAERLLANVRVHARYGVVIRDAKAFDAKTGFTAPPEDDVLPREWLSMELVQKDGKRRFQFDDAIAGPSSTKAITGFRLFDGDRYIAYEDKHLEVYPQKAAPQQDWESIVPRYYAFEMVYDGKEYARVPLACRFLATWIDGVIKGKPSNNYVVECRTNEAGQIVVETHPTERGRGRASGFVVDPARGYRLVGAWDELVSDTLHNRQVLTNEIAEVAPQLFFLKRSRRSFFSQKGMSTPQWEIETCDVTDVIVGDFEYDEAKFRMDSLPIAEGTVVSDHSSEPVHQFIYGKPPFTEDQLRGALGPAKARSNVSWLVVANIVVVIAACVYFFWKKRVSS